MSVLSEFKSFISRLNVLDLAVGFIIGGAFGKIISSLVADLLMPVLGLILGRVNLTSLKLTFGEELGTPVTLTYGNFLQTAFDFTIIAFALFMAVRTANKFKKAEEAAPAAAPTPSAEEVLLKDIRDILKSQKA